MRQFVICHVSRLLPDNLELGIRQNSKQLPNFLVLGFSTEKHIPKDPPSSRNILQLAVAHLLQWKLLKCHYR